VTVNPAEFCNLAHQIVLQAGPIQGEAAWRTAAGRAYYAVFLVTRDALREVHGKPNLKPDHNFWSDYRDVRQDKDVQVFGHRGGKLYQWRMWSDYHPWDKNVTDGTAQELVEECSSLLALVPTIKHKLPMPRDRHDKY
jgi:hypothetical protein